MSWMKWTPGRQGGDYRKMLLFRWLPWLDVYLIDYEPHTGLGWHRDIVDGRRHWRLNIMLRRGGALFVRKLDGALQLSYRRVEFFRSDDWHMVTKSMSRRLVLSFGFTLRGSK